MKVVVVEPGYQPYEKEIDGLAEMQAVVGGLITAAYPYEHLSFLSRICSTAAAW